MNVEDTDLPDEYVSDADAETEEMLATIDEIEDDLRDLHRLFEIHMANMMVTQMAIDEKITLAEMEALTNILMEYDDESELTIM